MKLLLLADPDSAHTIRWALGLDKLGHEVCVIGFSWQNHAAYQHTRVQVVAAGVDKSVVKGVRNSLRKLAYLGVLKAVKTRIRAFQPDVLHAHYASSYGLLGALTGFRPLVLSVWGSDVYEFPRRSVLHKWLLKFNLGQADRILSTSRAMATETQKYTSKSIEVTPFGIDMTVFQPGVEVHDKGEIVVGTIKGMERVYGIDVLIEAFDLLCRRLPREPLKLLLVGDGSQMGVYKSQVDVLGLADRVEFAGEIPYAEVVNYHHKIDVFVAVSRRESFGVSVLEASACGKPVVVSDVGGLPEVVANGHTGYVVPAGDAQKLSDAIAVLVKHEQTRKELGQNGINWVRVHYDWNKNLKQMEAIYHALNR